jgi:hypothetical protein
LSLACVDGKCALAGVAMAVDRRQKSYVVEVGTRRYEGPLVFSKFQLAGPDSTVALLAMSPDSSSRAIQSPRCRPRWPARTDRLSRAQALRVGGRRLRV